MSFFYAIQRHNTNDCNDDNISVSETSLFSQNDEKMLSKLKCSASLCATEASSFTQDSRRLFDDSSCAQIEFLNGEGISVNTVFDISNLQINNSASNPYLDDDDDEMMSILRKSKCLRFDVDENDSIIEYHYEYPVCDDIDAYTSTSEDRENRQLVMKQCRRFHRLQPELFGRLNEAYKNKDSDKDPTILNEWSASFLRGFESYLISEASMNIRAYVEFVVFYYHGLQELSELMIDNDINEMLRSRIVEKSQRSRDFAEYLATSDEIEARKYCY